MDPNRGLSHVRAAIVGVVAILALAFATPALADPAVSEVNPNHGPPAGGNLVTITGTGLIGTTEVDFGSFAATPNANTPTTVSVNAPPGVPGTVHVTVIAGGVRSAATDSDLYTYHPAISGLVPSHGPATGGNQVTLVGVGFSGVPTVLFGTRSAADVHQLGPTTITADAPPGKAGRTVEVTVTTPDGTSSLAGTGNDYTYDLKPKTFLKHHPRRRTHKRKVAFAFDSNVNQARFKCFDARGWVKCRSPYVFRRLEPGRYVFKVKAIAQGVADPTPASFIFRILR
jgi:hypothetical protein